MIRVKSSTSTFQENVELPLELLDQRIMPQFRFSYLMLMKMVELFMIKDTKLLYVVSLEIKVDQITKLKKFLELINTTLHNNDK